MKTLKKILSLPTAPFHEEIVARHVIKTCQSIGLKCVTDRYGNLLVHYRKGNGNQPVVFTAHMDHPGFEVITVKNGRSQVGILGGILPEHFIKSKVVVHTASGPVKGRIIKKLSSSWRKKPVFEITTDEKLKKGDFGWYDLPAVRIKKGMVYTKAADNLVSVAALLDLLSVLTRKNVKADVRCLFTRAEEVGFIGCISFAEQELLPKDVPIIVLECSSASAGHVKIGLGPVIRVGDKLSCFSSEIDCWLKSLADKKIRHQRALLAGGTCEASVWVLKNRPVGGLAFPLGNYHNNGPRGPAVEYISLNDYKWMLKFLLVISRSGRYNEVIKSISTRIMKNYKWWKEKL